MPPEAPICTIGTILSRLGPVLYLASLPNSKEVSAHLSKDLATRHAEFLPDDRVHLELTPYDFDQARITALHAGE